jgi:polysaccharide deacetylase family protein (PEP-CTERM system associated)
LRTINALSIDVEDYFQVSAFEKCVPVAHWDRYPLRVERSTRLVLELLARQGVRATFFILGWVAERCPELVRDIHRAGHEVASHGYGHRRVGTQSREQFRDDIRRAKALLEDLTGEAVLGYRAPSYSISLATLWAFDELLEAGYRYDSSVFPVRHDFYGIPDWPRFPFTVSRDAAGVWGPQGEPGAAAAAQLLEFPITTLSLLGRNIPIAGGGYFRFFPYDFTRWGLGRINTLEQRPFVFYLHPWELDPGQPRMADLSPKSRFRHYLNLHKTELRFSRLLRDFSFSTMRELLQDLQGVPLAQALPGALPETAQV